MTLGTLAILSVIRISKFCGPAQHLLFTESSTPRNFVDLLSTYSLRSHLRPAFSWTCSALTLYGVICALHFRDPAQHLLFTESSTPRNFVILLSTYSLQSHLHPAIQYPLPALTPYQFSSTSQKAPVMMTRAFLNVLSISYVRILYIYLRSLSMNPVKRPGVS